MGYTAHTDGHRDDTAHTHKSIVYLHTQKELDHCDLFSEIYDHFVKTHMDDYYFCEAVILTSASHTLTYKD